MGTTQAPEGRRSALERVLSMAAPVRAGEGVTVLLLAVNVFLLLMAYYLIKPVREALILATPGGAEFKSYSAGGSAALLFVAVPLYGKLVDSMSRNRLIACVNGFFILCMLAFYGAGQVDSLRAALGIPFYLWASVFSMMVVAQFWGFANDLYTDEQGKRLFAIVGLGATLGAVVGSKMTTLLLKPPALWPIPSLDVYQLLLLSSALLLVTIALTQWTHQRESGDTRATPSRPSEPSKAAPKGGFRLVRVTPYLRLLALFSLLFTFVNSNGEYVLGKLVSQASEQLPPDEQRGWIGSFYGDFYFYVNLGGFLLQTFAVSRIVKYGGLGVAFFVLPIVVLLGWTAFVIVPALGLLRITKTVENATDYSLNNTVRNMLWLPTTRDMKYKAKQVVDTVMVRLGDVSSALLVFFGVGVLGIGVRGFALTNLFLAVLWFVLAAAIVRGNARMLEERPEQSQ